MLDWVVFSTNEVGPQILQVTTTLVLHIFINPPALKVPARDSLEAEPMDSDNPLFTGAAGGGGFHLIDPPPKRGFSL